MAHPPNCRLVLAAGLALATASPVAADPTFGVGLTFVFGDGNGPGLTVKVFSDDEEDSVVASLGIDYLFQANRWRPNIGVAYLGEGWYIGPDLGLVLGDDQASVGISAGWADTEAPPAAAPAPPPGPTPNPTPTTPPTDEGTCDRFTEDCYAE
ncbi:hypothetical protein ACFORG_17770 [Lutimaribacter marinistellae]|uniref:Outer membrane protein beta-barrel domain-containing protein n=1 Tax=Lutimaribacter marinistellae TaxID=1820329 RepID=A0ABV7TM58_9RHOB